MHPLVNYRCMFIIYFYAFPYLMSVETLGHLLIFEPKAQHIWRMLVCTNEFPLMDLQKCLWCWRAINLLWLLGVCQLSQFADAPISPQRTLRSFKMVVAVEEILHKPHPITCLLGNVSSLDVFCRHGRRLFERSGSHDFSFACFCWPVCRSVYVTQTPPILGSFMLHSWKIGNYVSSENMQLQNN